MVQIYIKGYKPFDTLILSHKKRSAWDAHLAEVKLIATQYRLDAERSQANSLFQETPCFLFS